MRINKDISLGTHDPFATVLAMKTNMAVITKPRGLLRPVVK